MRKYFLIFFILCGCSINQNQSNDKSLKIVFSENLSFEDFKIRLDEYAKKQPFPNIDN